MMNYGRVRNWRAAELQFRAYIEPAARVEPMLEQRH
jgi:hypothetical protein